MSEILDELGLDAESFQWGDLALCRNTVDSPANDVFFDVYESDKESAKAADEMCMHCPVARECFFEGSKGKTGLWGGVYWNGAGAPDKNKNSHKTDEVWTQIHQRVKK